MYGLRPSKLVSCMRDTDDVSVSRCLSHACPCVCVCVSAGVSTSHKKKKRKTGGAADGGLFEGDGTGKTPGDGSGAAGGGAGGKGRGGSSGSAGGKARSNLSKTDLNKLKRGGKGKSSFKSKKKFKRR